MATTGSELGLPIEVGAAIVAARAAFWNDILWKRLAIDPCRMPRCLLCEASVEQEARVFFRVWSLGRG